MAPVLYLGKRFLLHLLYFYTLNSALQLINKQQRRDCIKNDINCNNNLPISSRKLAQSSTKAKILITKGQYVVEVMNVGSLRIFISPSETTWKEIKCFLSGPDNVQNEQSHWPTIQEWNPCPPVVNISSFDYKGYYNFTVEGIPASSVEGIVSNSSTWIIDKTPPNTFLSTNCSQRCPAYEKTFRFNGTDENGIGKYQCKIDNDNWFICNSPYTLKINQSNDISHKFQVRAIDKAGNIDISPASYSWSYNFSTTLVTLFRYVSAPVSRSTSRPSSRSRSRNSNSRSNSNGGYSTPYSGSADDENSLGRNTSLPTWAIILICLSPYLLGIVLLFFFWLCDRWFLSSS